MAKTDSTIIGAVGEHYVASYLSGFKLLVAMPRAGIPGTDLFVSNVVNGPAIRVQVKTGTQSYKKDKQHGEMYLWHSSKKATENVSKYLWYVFVWLNGWPTSGRLPKLFVVPSSAVGPCVQECIDAEEWPFFWFTVEESAKYEGTGGLQLMLDCLNSEVDLC